MAISTVLLLVPSMGSSKFMGFSTASIPFNYWLIDSPVKQSLKDNLVRPPNISYYPVRIAAPNPENVLYPVLIKPVVFEEDTISAGPSVYPDICSADALIVLFNIGIATRHGRRRHLENTSRVLEYARREKTNAPMYIIGINTDRSERNLIPTKGSLRPIAHKLAEQYRASYFECNSQYWQSWLADSDAHTTRAVMHKIYQQEVDRFRRSLTPDELRLYQDNNRIPMFNLATEATRREAVQSIYRGREKPERTIKLLQLLREKHINDKSSRAYKDLHASGFWGKYDQYFEQFKQDVKRLYALTNDIAYLDLSDADHLKSFLEIGQLRQKMEEARIRVRDAESLIKCWIVPEIKHPSPTHSDTEHSSSDENHSPKGSPSRQTAVSSPRPPAYNPDFQAQPLPYKPEPSAPPISQRFTSNASFFRAEPASAARADDVPNSTSLRLVHEKIAVSLKEQIADHEKLSQKLANVDVTFDQVCQILNRQINAAYTEAFKDSKRVLNALKKALRKPPRQSNTDLASLSYAERVIETVINSKLSASAQRLLTEFPKSFQNVTQNRIELTLHELLKPRITKLKKSKSMKANMSELNQIASDRIQLQSQIQKCDSLINYLRDPKTPSAMLETVSRLKTEQGSASNHGMSI